MFRAMAEAMASCLVRLGYDTVSRACRLGQGIPEAGRLLAFRQRQHRRADVRRGRRCRLCMPHWRLSVVCRVRGGTLVDVDGDPDSTRRTEETLGPHRERGRKQILRTVAVSV